MRLTERQVNLLRDLIPTPEEKGKRIFHYPVFELFVDCLWGLAVFFALHLLSFSFSSTESLSSLAATSGVWFQGLIFVVFIYLFGLRLRRHLMWHNVVKKAKLVLTPSTREDEADYWTRRLAALCASERGAGTPHGCSAGAVKVSSHVER